ncbi:MAG: porin [Shimia sp.]
MKNVLLASTALVAFAGAAAADVSFSGDANFKYLSGGTVDANASAGTPAVTTTERFDWGVDFNIAFSQELDNGLTAGVAMELDIVDDEVNGDGSLDVSDFVVSLTGDMAGLFIGDTQAAAKNRWASAGDMEADDFSSQDGGNGEVYLRGDVTFGSVEMSIGGILGEIATKDANATYDASNATLEQLSFGAVATFGTVKAILAYQEEGPAAGLDAVSGDYVGASVLGVNLSTTLAGATVELAYAARDDFGGNNGETSTGLEVTYPIGDTITLGAYYVMEDDDTNPNEEDNYGVSVKYAQGPLTVGVFYRQEQTVDDYGIDLDYDLGNGVTLYAGFAGGNGSDDGYYLGGKYDLGGGAAFEATFVDAGIRDTGDEYFEGDWAQGTTLALSFKF